MHSQIWKLPFDCKPTVSILHGHDRAVTCVVPYDRLLVRCATSPCLATLMCLVCTEQRA